MGGKITFQSRENVGTKFDIDIPVEVAGTPVLESSAANRRVTGIAPGQMSHRLLVVEDNKHSRDLLCKLLKNVGFEVQEAVNSQEAVQKWKKWKPHLIWMDMRMPVIDGYQATAKIKPGSKYWGCIIIDLPDDLYVGKQKAVEAVDYDKTLIMLGKIQDYNESLANILK